jgi:putative PIN family toxin of toxin-antitoxin system
VKAVADCNTYISGLLFKGPPSEFLRQAQLGTLQLYISTPIFDEIVGVLDREKFGLTHLEIARFRRIIERTVWKIEPKAGVDAVKADPTDNRVIECALECQADLIVSGDKHLLQMKSYAGIPIMSVREFLERGRER